MTFTLRPRVLTQILAAIAAALLAAHLVGAMVVGSWPSHPASGLYRRFCFNLEATVPAFFSALMLLTAGGLAGVIGTARGRQNRPWARHWQVLAVIFVYLAVDESSAFHEATMRVLRERLGVGGVFFYAWVIPAGVLVLVVGLAYLRFVLSLPPPIRGWVIAGGVLYVAGALGMEMVGGYVFSHRGEGWHYFLAYTTEETLEMMGLIAFLHGLMLYMRETLPQIRLRFAARQQRAHIRHPEPSVPLGQRL